MPSGDELARYYNSAYSVPFEGYIRSVTIQFPPLLRAVQKVADPPGRMLELGCSYGAMLARFRSRGWQVEGVELDERAVSIARATFGIPVTQGRIEDVVGSLTPPYDVIAAYHVIEHIPDPAPLCRLLRSLLRPGGSLILKTPNGSCLAAKMVGGWWEWYAPPEHVHVFSPRSLAILLRSANLRVDSSTTRRGDGRALPFELARATAKRLAGRERTNVPGEVRTFTPYGRRAWFRGVERAIGVLSTPVEFALDAAYRTGFDGGPELLVVASPTD
jgi:SAM-dependent methyltransferase